MDQDDFRKEFLENSRVAAAETGNFKEAAFVAECAEKLQEAEELAGFEPCYYDSTGARNRRLRVDGYWFDDLDESVTLFVAHYSGQADTTTLTQTVINKLFGSLAAFVAEAVSGRLTLSIEESSPAFGLASELLTRHDHGRISKFKAILVSDAVLSSRVKYQPEGEFTEISVEYHIWDISRFHRVFESSVGRDDLVINFADFGCVGLPCVEAGVTSQGYHAYLCVIPGQLLAQLYERFGSRLLEGNVRSFLSANVRVNKDIRATILNEPGMFFAYNNGISATSTDVVLERSKEGVRLKQATHLQIVNGGQTTASIANASRKDKAQLDRIFVPMKLSVIEPSDAETVIPRISFCANSQNKVSDADFFANHPFHVRFEEFSRRLWAPATGGAQHETHWFYERARGQYINEQLSRTPSDKKRFLLQNPRNQLITKTNLAKYEVSWQKKPHLVSRGAQKNFVEFAKSVSERWKMSEAEFNEEYFRSAVARAIIFQHTERMVSEQSWYQNGYRANIVTYSVAKLISLIEKKFPGMTLDLKAIWSRQAISESLSAQLQLIAKAAFDVIVTPLTAYQNVTEWCKNELCWSRVSEAEVDIAESFAAELVSISELREGGRDAKAQQRMDNRIKAQFAVVELGADFWKRLMQWGMKQSLLGADHLSVLRIASQMPSKLPSEFQSVELLDIKSRMEQEGMPQS